MCMLCSFLFKYMHLNLHVKFVTQKGNIGCSLCTGSTVNNEMFYYKIITNSSFLNIKTDFHQL